MAPPAGGPEAAAAAGAAAPGPACCRARRLAAALGPCALAEVALGLAAAGVLATLAAPGAATATPRALAAAPPRRLAAVEEAGQGTRALAEELRHLEGARRALAQGRRLLRQASEEARAGLRELRGQAGRAAEGASDEGGASSRSQEVRCRAVHWSEECTFLPSDLVARMGGDVINGSADCAVVVAATSQATAQRFWKDLKGMGRRIDAHSFVVRATSMPAEEVAGQLGSKTSMYFLHSKGRNKKPNYNIGPARIHIQHLGSKGTLLCDVRNRSGCAFDAVLFKDMPAQHRDVWRRAKLPVGMLTYEMAQTLVHLYNLRFNVTAPAQASQTRPANAFAAFVTTALLCNAVTGYGITGSDSNEHVLMRELASGQAALDRGGAAAGPARGPHPSSFADRAHRCLQAKARAGCIRVAT